MYRLKTEKAGYKLDVDIFNRLEIFLGRFSNKMLSILNSLKYFKTFDAGIRSYFIPNLNSH